MSVNIKGVVKSAAFSVAVTFVIIFVLALVSYFSNVSENTVTVGAYAAVIIGVLLGAVITAKAAQGKKLVHALLMGLIYTVVLAGISCAVNGFIGFNAHTAAVIGGIFAAAVLGSVLGAGR